MSKRRINILMYHSLSEGEGPTCIAPNVFRQHLEALEDSGYRIAPLAAVAGWLRGEAELPERTAVLTFDDGFEDFATVAFPELQRRSWPATVFLPAGKVGGADDWESGSRRLMSWRTVAELTQAGVAFGGHGVTHADLTTLAPDAARAEIVHAKHLIEGWTGKPVISFAAPFGRTNPRVRQIIKGEYEAAVGTTLARVAPGADRHDLPRVEMWYFRKPARWRAYLEGRGEGHFFFRRVLRKARGILQAWTSRNRNQELSCQPT